MVTQVGVRVGNLEQGCHRSRGEARVPGTRWSEAGVRLGDQEQDGHSSRQG